MTTYDTLLEQLESLDPSTIEVADTRNPETAFKCFIGAIRKQGVKIHRALENALAHHCARDIYRAAKEESPKDISRVYPEIALEFITYNLREARFIFEPVFNSRRYLPPNTLKLAPLRRLIKSQGTR